MNFPDQLRAFFLICAVLIALPDTAAGNQAHCVLKRISDGREFKVFDSLSYLRKPDLTKYCLERIHLVYAGELWGRNKGGRHGPLPAKARVAKALRKALRRTSHYKVLDIEHWPLRGDLSTIYSSVEKLLTVHHWFKSAAPHLSWGYYGLVPIRDYWRAVKGPAHPKYREWQAENDRLSVLADSVDAIYPSIYTFYKDPKGWKLYAAAQISEARRLAPNKKVFAFIWPRYHSSNRMLGGQEIEGRYWREHLHFLQAKVDGIVLWDVQKKKTWDEDAPWWTETKKFLTVEFDRTRDGLP